MEDMSLFLPLAAGLPFFDTLSRISPGITLGMFVITLIWVYYSFRFFRSHATTLAISILGFPGTGKSVYLVALFDALQRTSSPGMIFNPYGRQTIEEVSNNLNTLASGQWLPKTAPGTVFFYRATATTGVGFFRRSYKIEVGDYAGERMGELDPTNAQWLHRTEYFKYVLQSDAILLTIDSEVIISAGTAENQRLQNAFIAAIQVLAEEKGATDNHKLVTPVALMFMKADLIRDGGGDVLQRAARRLIEVCKVRCANFKIFYVSSTGPLGESGKPPTRLRPIGVVEPLIWILQKHRGLFPSMALGSRKEERASAKERAS